MGKFSKIIISLLLLDLLTGSDPETVLAQSYSSRNITIENGLPSNSVQDIFKDSRGIMWFGTEAGLCRYDGINFRTYTTLDGLPGNRVWSVTEDREGNLWIACYGSGISKFDGKHFQNFSGTDGLINNNVRKIEYSKKHNGLMIGTDYGFSFYRNSKFCSFVDSAATDRNLFQVTSFLDTDSLIYLFTYYDSKRFVLFNPGTRRFRYLDSLNRFHYKTHYSTTSFVTSSNDTIIGDYTWGIKTYSKNSFTVNDTVGQIFDIAEDRTGTLWLASWNNGKIADKKAKGGLYRLKDSKTDYMNEAIGIESQLCFSLFYDNNENLLWIGTLDRGIYVFPLSGIECIQASAFNKIKPLFNDIFIDTKENIWMSVGNRIIKNEREDMISSLKNMLDEFRKLTKNKYSFLVDRDGSFEKYNLLIKNGIYKYSNPYFTSGILRKKGTLYYPEAYKTLQNDSLTDFSNFFEDNTGSIWVNSNCGLTLIFDRKRAAYIRDWRHQSAFFLESDSVFATLGTYELVRYSLNDQKYLSLLPVRKNTTYASFINYLKDEDSYWLYNDTEGITMYRHGTLTDFPYLYGKMDPGINCMGKDNFDNLIAGTNTGKIYILRHEGDSLKILYKITTEDGIAGTDIKWVITDKNSQLWLATNKGLNKINLPLLYENGQVQVCFYNEENGLTDKTTKKCIIDSKGNLHFISDEKLFRLNPAEFVNGKSESFPLVSDGIDINFKPSEWSEITKSDNWNVLPSGRFRIPYNKNTLTFYFHLLQYGEPSKARYRYKLEGFQQDWTPYTSETKAVFTNLPDGNYSLKIHGSLLSDPGQVSVLEINFRILPPWWKKWWSVLASIILISAASFLFFRYRIGLIKKESEINQKIASLKLEALKAQMNPHFIFNAFNSIQKYILNQDSKSALNYMSDFAALIRKTLDNSTREVTSLTDEISYLRSYIELEQRRVPNLTYRIDKDNEIDTDEIYLPPMLIQPVVENSILHGIRHMDKEGLIIISFSLSGETGRLICTVEDNGIGREESKNLYNSQGKTHSSMGSQIIQQRADLFGVKVKITDLYKDGAVAGTSVDFLF
jgi:ligand-binding sensor domain-containing protein/two-component sensor histidine kinase